MNPTIIRCNCPQCQPLPGTTCPAVSENCENIKDSLVFPFREAEKYTADFDLLRNTLRERDAQNTKLHRDNERLRTALEYVQANHHEGAGEFEDRIAAALEAEA